MDDIVSKLFIFFQTPIGFLMLLVIVVLLILIVRGDRAISAARSASKFRKKPKSNSVDGSSSMPTDSLYEVQETSILITVGLTVVLACFVSPIGFAFNVSPIVVGIVAGVAIGLIASPNLNGLLAGISGGSFGGALIATGALANAAIAFQSIFN